MLFKYKIIMIDKIIVNKIIINRMIMNKIIVSIGSKKIS